MSDDPAKNDSLTGDPARSDPVKVAIADDHAMIREALSSVLEGVPGIEVVARCGDAAEALEVLRSTRLDVLILDYNMPAGGALPVLEEIRAKNLPVRTLILTVHESLHYAIRVLEAGASGFLVKSSAVEELVEAIQQVHEGEIYITPTVSRRVLDQLRRPKRDRIGVASLSPREFDLLCVLGTGMGIKEAAQRLKISVSSASTYRARLMKKLNLANTMELIRFALENELVT